MKTLLSFVLVWTVLTTSVPLAEAQSGILASAERLVSTASTVEVVQDGGPVAESTQRRMRSRGMTMSGIGLVAVGLALALRPPRCDMQETSTTVRTVLNGGTDNWGNRWQYRPVYLARSGGESGCDVRIDVRRTENLYLLPDRPQLIQALADAQTIPPGGHVEYVSDAKAGRTVYALPSEVAGVEAISNRNRNNIGIAIAAGGVVLAALGMRRVDVPVRGELMLGRRGGRVVRSFGW